MKPIDPNGFTLRTRFTLYAVLLTVAAMALISAFSYILFHNQLNERFAAVPAGELHNLLHATAIGVISAFVCIALLAALIIWNVLGRMMTPLQRVINHIGSMSAKQGKERFLPEGFEGELGRLAQVFNTLVEDFDDQREVMRLTQQTYRIVAELTDEVAFWRDADNSIQFMSANCLEVTGYTESEFYAQPDLLDRIVHPDYREDWDGHTHKIDSATRKSRKLELKIVTKSGEERWVSHLCHEVHDDKGIYRGKRGNFTDITPLKRMQQLMQDQKAFAEGLINNATVPIFVLDPEHRVIVWNSALENLSGFRAEEMLGTTRQWEAFYPQQRPVLADLLLSQDISCLNDLYQSSRLSQHIKGGLQSEGWFDNVGGQRRYLFFDAAPVIDANGRPVAAIETLLDITDRKLAEEEQRKLSWAVSENPCSIVITDPQGNIEYANKKFCSLTGYSYDEIVGQNQRVLKSGETPTEVYRELWRTITSGQTWHGEFHNKKKNGELFWELVSISPVKDEQGTITHYLAVKEDITQRKSNEQELAKSREELQLKHSELSELFAQVESGRREWEDTMDSLSEMVLICDQWGVIRRCNRAVCTFAMLSYEQIVGVECLELFSRIGMEISGYDGKSGHLVYDNGQRHFELLSNTLKQIGSDEIRGVVVTIHETSELLKVNEELQKAYAELQQTQAQVYQQEKMASIGQLAAGVAHEINNPMGFISSNLSTMGKYMDKIKVFETAVIEALHGLGDSEAVATLTELRRKLKIDFVLEDTGNLLAESLDGAERVRRIVQDLKSFSHVDDTQCKPFNINDCLETTLNMLRNEIKYVAEVERDYDDNLPLLNCYPQQLNQVFMNILANAAHAIEGHGVISVQTRCQGNCIAIKLSDNGKGIAPENLSRIFEPFFTTKEVGKGTGLGLSISYDIIKKHGGEMNVESELGRGTTFTVKLPLNHTF